MNAFLVIILMTVFFLLLSIEGKLRDISSLLVEMRDENNKDDRKSDEDFSQL